VNVWSLLFVPGDRPDRIDKAMASGADAVIFDLEDSGAAQSKAAACSAVASVLARTHRPLPLFVRVNPVELGMLEDDVAAARGADGLVLPKAESATSVRTFDAATGDSALVLPIATETPAAMFRLEGCGEIAERLFVLTWGAEDLSAAICAVSARDEVGVTPRPMSWPAS